MADSYFNPFQAIDINVPVEFHEALQRYCGKTTDESPFPRMIDFWFTAVCVAARLNLKPADVEKYKTKKIETIKIIDGTIFSSDPWRVHALMLLAIEKSGDLGIVSEPRRMMDIASGLAIAGLPRVVEMLKDGNSGPIWNLSDALDSILRDSKVA